MLASVRLKDELRTPKGKIQDRAARSYSLVMEKGLSIKAFFEELGSHFLGHGPL